MRHSLFVLARASTLAVTWLLAVCPDGAAAVEETPSPQVLAERIIAEVDPVRLHQSVQRLVDFGTRHTTSDTTSEVRGIGAARRWVQGQFASLSANCGDCLSIVTPTETISGERLLHPTEIVDVVAIQRGSGDPNRVVMITAHIDSRVSDVMNATDDAPGANDDASGVAAVLECARVLSQYRFAATIVYGVLSGEEQGLYGGRVLANYSRSQGWHLIADLNNDIVGNTDGQDGLHDNTTVRVFSEGTRALETPAEASRRRYNGGEVDSPSRNLSRYLSRIAEQRMTNFSVEQVYRTDRFGRGGDQVEFLEHGYPAVRLTEAHENYTRQHQDVRSADGVRYGDTIDGVDFSYLAQVTRLNALALGNLAASPAPPDQVSIEGAVSSDTLLHWRAVPNAASYKIYWRATTAAQWQFQRLIPVEAGTNAKLANISIDNWFFGVASVSPDGYESPVVFPGTTGAF